jgi:hypothetical protein
MTPAELDRYGTRTYAGTTRDQMMRATVGALKSLGYDVVSVDEAAGRVKTAPKLVVVNAAATSRYTAQGVESTMAWTVDVTNGGSGVVVHASPRGYTAGQAVEATNLNADYMERAFTTLFDEIQSEVPSSVHGKQAAAPPAALDASRTKTSEADRAPTKPVTQANAAKSVAGETRTTAATVAPAPPPPADPPPAVPAAGESGGGFNSAPDPLGAGVSFAALLGYGFNDATQVGFGARGGYTLPMKLYLGGLFMYHLGSSTTVGAGGFYATSHVNVYYLGVEGGYDITAGPLVVRPYAGLGPVWASVSVQSNTPAPVPVQGTAASSSNVGLWLGGAVLYPVTPNVGLGGDARELIVNGYSTFNLLLAAAYRF